MKKITILSMFAIPGLILFKYGGQLHFGLQVLLALMGLDVITGLIKACMGNSEKTIKGFLDSNIMFKGGLKKILILIVISVSALVNKLLNPESLLLVNLTITYYIATEALSILENATACDLPLPDKLIKALEKIKDDSKYNN